MYKFIHFYFPLFVHLNFYHLHLSFRWFNQYYNLNWLLNVQLYLSAGYSQRRFFLSIPSRPPKVRTITFTPCNRYIYSARFGQYWTLTCLAVSSALYDPYMQVSVCRFGTLPSASFKFHFTMDTIAFGYRKFLCKYIVLFSEDNIYNFNQQIKYLTSSLLQ